MTAYYLAPDSEILHAAEYMDAEIPEGSFIYNTLNQRYYYKAGSAVISLRSVDPRLIYLKTHLLLQGITS